jgi:hypothetical protein
MEEREEEEGTNHEKGVRTSRQDIYGLAIPAT